MNSIEILKHELAEQKKSIESKGGVVSVSNTNVSPSEITAGIKSIPDADYSQGTAVESDVLLGKTFYAGDKTLKTGSLVMSSTSESDQNLIDYVLYGKQADNYPNLEIHLPEQVTHIKEYFLHNSKCKCDVYINQSVESVGDMAFYQGVDTTIYDLDKASSLNSVGASSFRGTKGIDLSSLPDSISNIDNNGFGDCALYSNSITVPQSLSTVGTYAFACSSLTNIDSIDMSKALNVTYGLYFFSNIKCLDHLVIPEGITTLSSYFNYNGSMRSVTFPSTFTKLNTGAFNAKETVPIEDLITEFYVFKSQTPPTFTTTSICTRLKNKANFKIYVPDESIDSYKSTSVISSYKDFIFPISQKP